MIAHDLALAIVRYENLYYEFKPKLSITQLVVMGAIENNKTHIAAQIHEKTGLRNEVIRLVTKGLIKRGWVVRGHKKGYKSGRPMIITDAGEQAYEEGMAIIRRVDKEFLSAAGVTGAEDFSWVIAALAKTTLTASQIRTRARS